MLKNLKIIYKLTLLSLLPLLGLLYFASVILLQEADFFSEMETLTQISRVSTAAGALVHELQYERGLAVGYLSSQGKKFANSLNTQQQATNQAQLAFQKILTEIDIAEFGKGYNNELKAAFRGLDQLNQKRREIKALKISIEATLTYYSNVNSHFLDMIEDMIRLSTNTELTKFILAYTSLLQEKESAGIERAILMAVFTQDRFSKNLLQHLLGLITKQKIYNHLFLTLTEEEHSQYFQEKSKNPAIYESEKMRKIALNQANVGEFGIDPNDWFQAQTTKISFLKNVEERLSQDLIKHSQELAVSARNSLIAEIVITFLLVVIVIGCSFFLATDISRSLDKVVFLISLMKQGFLNKRLNLERRDEIGIMAQGMDIFTTELEQLMAQTNHASEQVDKVSSQNADVSQSLAGGVSAQASAIEQISASVTQIATQIDQNAQNAIQANNLADDAQKAGELGNQQMNEMLQAMNAIEAASQNISKIIKVIDEIAFQTNLLALNAAVEAARAGIHGKGFAVVANEVRSLAVRSANAAAETTELIEDTVVKVKNGTEATNQTATGLADIVADVRKVNDLLKEIAAASREQASGTSQIQKALNQLEQITHQNSSVSEQVAEQANTMQKQAKDLRQLLVRFKLSEKSPVALPPAQPLPQDAPPSPKDSAPPVATTKNEAPFIMLEDEDFERF